MGRIIKHKRDYFTKLPLMLLSIFFVGVSPVLIGILGARITESLTGQPCHEGNCGWMVLPWLGMITIPLAGLVLIVVVIVALSDAVSLRDTRHEDRN
jgi:hypothetical protein